MATYHQVLLTDFTSTTESDLISASFTLSSPDTVITATGVFDMQSGTTSGAVVGKCAINSTDFTTGVAVVGGASGTRATAAQTWVAAGLSPGEYTITLRGICNSNGVIRGTNTTLTVVTSPS